MTDVNETSSARHHRRLIVVGAVLIVAALVLVVGLVALVFKPGTPNAVALTQTVETKGVPTFEARAKTVPGWYQAPDNRTAPGQIYYAGQSPVAKTVTITKSGNDTGCSLVAQTGFLPAYANKFSEAYNSYSLLYSTVTGSQALPTGNGTADLTSTTGAKITFATAKYGYVDSGSKKGVARWVAARAVNGVYGNGIKTPGTPAKDLFGNPVTKGVPALLVTYQCIGKTASIPQLSATTWDQLLAALTFQIK